MSSLTIGALPPASTAKILNLPLPAFGEKAAYLYRVDENSNHVQFVVPTEIPSLMGNAYIEKVIELKENNQFSPNRIILDLKDPKTPFVQVSVLTSGDFKGKTASYALPQNHEKFVPLWNLFFEKI